MTHPVSGIDDVVHQRTRLGILAILLQVGQADFSALRDELAVSDGALSQHLRVLEEAGYVAIEKGYQGRRPRTWAKITPAGSRAVRLELALLRKVVESANETRKSTRGAQVRTASRQRGARARQGTLAPRLA